MTIPMKIATAVILKGAHRTFKHLAIVPDRAEIPVVVHGWYWRFTAYSRSLTGLVDAEDSLVTRVSSLSGLSSLSAGIAERLRLPESYIFLNSLVEQLRKAGSCSRRTPARWWEWPPRPGNLHHALLDLRAGATSMAGRNRSHPPARVEGRHGFIGIGGTPAAGRRAW